MATLWFCRQCRHQGPHLLTDVNSLGGRFGNNFEDVISDHIFEIKFMSASCWIAFSWMWHYIFGDRWRVANEIAWCHQATSHYLSQCIPRSLSPYDVIRPPNQLTEVWEWTCNYIHNFVWDAIQHPCPSLSDLVKTLIQNFYIFGISKRNPLFGIINVADFIWIIVL